MGISREDRPGIADAKWWRMQNPWTLRVDGAWLAIMGTLAGLFDLVGYFAGKGPFGGQQGMGVVIGQFEAHGLAVIVGCLIARNAIVLSTRSRHAIAVITHILLGTANVVFWKMFVSMNLLAMGYATTALHAVFVVLNAICFVATTNPKPARPEASPA